MNTTNQKPFLKKALIAAALAGSGMTSMLVFAEEPHRADKAEEDSPGLEHGSTGR